MTDSDETASGRLRELALVFLKLGATAFGGPVAHMALMEQEFVRNRNWLNKEEFLDLVSAANLIPGPNSTELAIHIGRRHAGFPGLIVSGACFIIPAAVMVGTFAWAYVRFGGLPHVEGILYCIKPVMIAVVVQALWRLARAAVKTVLLGVVGVLAGTLCFLGTNELAILFGTGLFVMLIRSSTCRRPNLYSYLAPWIGFGSLSGVPMVAGAAVTGGAVPFAIWKMFLLFLKVGSILFGSGYVLLAFLRADLVDRFGWLTEGQLIDAIAVGQVTPGPMLTTATFIGFVLGGPVAATLATIAIFVPAFVFVAISAPLIPRIRESRIARGFLDGANVASLALMGVASWRLGNSAILDWKTVLFFGIAALLLIRFHVNSVWLILAACVAGLLFTR